MKALILACSLIFLGSCTSAPQKADLDPAIPQMTDNEYQDLIEKYTRDEKKYDGFYNKYEVYVTIVNSEVNAAITSRMAQFLRWDLNKYRSEREKTIQEMSSQTKFYFSLFTPDRDYNDLNKANTIWKIYLETNGTRYQGTIAKSKWKLAELMSVFSHHTRWAKGYYVTFSIPMSVVETTESKIIFTSNLGTTELKFPAIAK